MPERVRALMSVGMSDPSGESRRQVRRVYVRHQSLSGDLFVPTMDFETLGELKLEATERLEALGVVLPSGLKVIRRGPGPRSSKAHPRARPAARLDGLMDVPPAPVSAKHRTTSSFLSQYSQTLRFRLRMIVCVCMCHN